MSLTCLNPSMSRKITALDGSGSSVLDSCGGSASAPSTCARNWARLGRPVSPSCRAACWVASSEAIQAIEKASREAAASRKAVVVAVYRSGVVSQVTSTPQGPAEVWTATTAQLRAPAGAGRGKSPGLSVRSVSYTHLRAHETDSYLV